MSILNMLYWSGSWWYAIYDLSLTNDETNEKVIVKWFEYMPANWVKTVVRYKTGSAPTSPTDWTLAVQETTKNQYSSTGYWVSWLSDNTTYYFSVFAIDSNGTIINVQSSSITTDLGVPRDWLLWYWKLQSDLLDYSWNWHNWSWYSWTWYFSSWQWYIWARITNGWSSRNYITTQHVKTNLVYGSRPISICFWFNALSRWDWCWIISNANYSDILTDYCMRLSWSSDQWHANDLISSLWNNNNNIITTYDIDTWYFFVITIDSSWNWKIYRNWNNVVNSWTWWLNATNSWNWRIWARNSWPWVERWIDWLMRHCAIYNKVISTDEITKFYNRTK